MTTPRRDRTTRVRGPAHPTAWKRRVAHFVVVIVALWPFVHRVLVARLDVNPWKLGGFAMYATPTPPVLIAIFRPVPGGWRLLDRQAMPIATWAIIDRFERERHAIGDLRTPDDVAHAVFASRPDLGELAVIIERMRLDPATARMTSRKARYRYDRIGRLPIAQQRRMHETTQGVS